jgi:hypothetical protein
MTKEELELELAAKNDGDAFRLAIKLGIDFRGVSLPHYCGFEAYNGVTPAAFERIGDDPLKAARRAIVRAAADLVKLKETSND